MIILPAFGPAFVSPRIRALACEEFEHECVPLIRRLNVHYVPAFLEHHGPPIRRCTCLTSATPRFRPPLEGELEALVRGGEAE